MCQAIENDIQEIMDDQFEDGPFSTGLTAIASNISFPPVQTKVLTPLQYRSPLCNYSLESRPVSTTDEPSINAETAQLSIQLSGVSISAPSHTVKSATRATTISNVDTKCDIKSGKQPKWKYSSREYPKRGESQFEWKPFSVPFPIDIDRLPSTQIAFFDTETTGLSPENDRIIEIGVVLRDYENMLEKRWYSLVNPEGKRSVFGAFKAHSIEDARLCAEPKFFEVFDSFLQFVGNRPMVAHNAQFDDRMLAAEIKRCIDNEGYEGRIKKQNMTTEIDDASSSSNQGELNFNPVTGTLTNPMYCTCATARKFRRSKNKLDDLCDEYGVDKSILRKEYHGALQDTILLADVFPYIMRDADYQLILVVNDSTSSTVPTPGSTGATPSTNRSIQPTPLSTSRGGIEDGRSVIEDARRNDEVCNLLVDFELESAS